MVKLLSSNVVLIHIITIIVEHLFTIVSSAFSFLSLCIFDCFKYLIDVIYIYVTTRKTEIFLYLFLTYITSSHIFSIYLLRHYF